MAVEARNTGKPWTRELDELLLALDDAGATREHIAQELGRTIAAIDARLQELHRQLDDTPGFRNCVYYAPSRQWCGEWSQPVAPEYHCGRYRSERGEDGPVRTYRLEEVEGSMARGGPVTTERVIWFDNVKGKNSKAQGRFCTVPQSDKAAVRLSTELMGWVRRHGREVMRCQIGALVSRREIWIGMDDHGPFKVSLPADGGQSRTIGGQHLTGRLKGSGMPPGRYFLDEQRSDGTTLILVYQEKEVQAS